MNRSRAPSINSQPLAIKLPLLTATAFLVLMTLVAVLALIQQYKAIDQNAKELIRLSFSQHSAAVRRALAQNDQGRLELIVSSMALHDDVNLVAITDKGLSILASSQFNLVGNNLSQASMDLPIKLQAHETGLQILPTHSGWVGKAHVPFFPQQLTSSQKQDALFWIWVNTSRRHAKAIEKAFATLLPITVSGLLIELGMLFWLRKNVTLPLLQLSHRAKRIAQGELNTPLQSQGQGEIASLSHALHHMVGKLRDSLEALRTSEQCLSATLDSIGDGVLVTDLQGRITRLNPRAEKLTGWPEEEALGRYTAEVLHIVDTETREPAELPVAKVLRKGQMLELSRHTTLISRNGDDYQIAHSAAPIIDENGHTYGVIMVFRNITRQYKAEKQMTALSYRLKAILQSLPDHCFVLGKSGTYLEVLGGPDELLAHNREVLQGSNIHDILPAHTAELVQNTIDATLETQQPQSILYQLETFSGKKHFQGSTAPILLENDEQAVVWLARDITRLIEAEQQLEHIAYHDPLTGLANRLQLDSYLEQALARAQRLEYTLGILFLDIDLFKEINDTLGHQAGDQVLAHFSSLLSDLLRTGDLVSRFGGDEFVVILENIGPDSMTAATHAQNSAANIQQRLNAPVDILGNNIKLSVSIGIGIFSPPEDEGKTSETLLKEADLALYRAKESGRNRFRFFSREMQDAVEERVWLKHALIKALQTDQFELYVQPKTDASGKWIGGEVLLRWNHPERGEIPPASFIPIAEKIGLIHDVDQWVMQHSMAGIASYTEAIPSGFRLSVNINADLLLEPDFINNLELWLLHSAIHPELLEIEITERLFMENMEDAIAVMNNLRQRGIQFSIDDFGTGYSSLRYLQQLPIDVLKIDKGFVDHIPDSLADNQIAMTILDMAKNLGLSTIAEGVETREQLDFLQRHGCNHFQGYYFARPMPLSRFFEQLQKHL